MHLLSALTIDTGFVSVTSDSEDGTDALGNAHMRYACFLRSFPMAVLETVPIFQWMNTKHFLSNGGTSGTSCLFLSLLQAANTVMLWSAHFLSLCFRLPTLSCSGLHTSCLSASGCQHCHALVCTLPVSLLQAANTVMLLFAHFMSLCFRLPTLSCSCLHTSCLSASFCQHCHALVCTLPVSLLHSVNTVMLWSAHFLSLCFRLSTLSCSCLHTSCLSASFCQHCHALVCTLPVSLLQAANTVMLWFAHFLSLCFRLPTLSCSGLHTSCLSASGCQHCHAMVCTLPVSLLQAANTVMLWSAHFLSLCFRLSTLSCVSLLQAANTVMLWFAHFLSLCFRLSTLSCYGLHTSCLSASGCQHCHVSLCFRLSALSCVCLLQAVNTVMSLSASGCQHRYESLCFRLSTLSCSGLHTSCLSASGCQHCHAMVCTLPVSLLQAVKTVILWSAHFLSFCLRLPTLSCSGLSLHRKLLKSLSTSTWLKAWFSPRL